MTVQEEFDLMMQRSGIIEWHNAGFKGQGINILNCESGKTTHGAGTGGIIKRVAPNANIMYGSTGINTKGDELISATVELDNGQRFDLYEYVKANNIHILSASKSGISGDCEGWNAYCKKMQDDTGVIIFNAAANEGVGDGETLSSHFPSNVAILVGALTINNVRANYSSVGKELDFVAYSGIIGGTSAATPFLAGMCGLILCRYGTMKFTEMYKYLQMISKDLGTAGFDTYHGWGQPILPPLNKKYITMTTTSNDYFVDGVKKTMDTKPVNKEGNVFVPIRAISEGLGKTVEWKFNQDKSINIVVTDANTRVELNTGSDIMYKNGAKVILNFAPYIDSNNRTLVPIRAIAEAFNCKLSWVQSEAKVMILEV